ncbi:pseudaminic acid cytidylyltransferase [Afipia broomeae]|uniref:Pseudaminic acid CMP-transferase n=1 Tax=Afipia broomeae ATCC 49717 TaxID=883078 RepID=K8P6L0_9BRAD|nr:pseudaminic acid cytidylyltransferase [Afipia broomeae]EKS36379.1 pseudaminic acid CMP-transferase [Afipia broomeae ATCC 49717]
MRIAIVPARGGSKRIPEKNIVNFLGVPLMSYPIRAAKASGLFDTIHISTDSDRIASVAADLGYPVDFMRAPELADDHTPLMPVLQWTLDQFARRGKLFDTVCLLFPTAPLIDADDLVRGAELFDRRGNNRTVMAISRFNVPIEWAFHQESDGTLKACQPGMADVRSQDIRPTFYDAGTFSFIPAQEVRAGKIDETRMVGLMIPRHKAVDIDDAEDLELAEMLARGRQKT